MSRRFSPNGTLVDEPSIRAASAAVLYGKGVFTTVAVRDGALFLWEKHWNRLTSNASRLSIDIAALDREGTSATIAGLVGQQKTTSGRVRITILDESSNSIWPNGGERKSSLLVMVSENRVRPEHIRLTLSTSLFNSTSPLAGVKSCNYLEHLMAHDDARGRGFDEAIRINERGHVTSACMANVFWENDGKLFTPVLSTGCLPGTTREFILESFECEEVESGLEALESADRIFLTSAGLGVAGVSEFNGRKFDTSEHPMLSLIPN